MLDALREAKPHLKREAKMETIAEHYRGEGRVEGRVETLQRQLEHRFGTLSVQERAQIEAATIKQLDAWLDEVLDADSVDAVLKNGAKGANGSGGSNGTDGQNGGGGAAG